MRVDGWRLDGRVGFCPRSVAALLALAGHQLDLLTLPRLVLLRLLCSVPVLALLLLALLAGLLRLRRLLAVLGRGSPPGRLHDVDDALVPRPLQALVHDDAPRDGPDALHALLGAQPPHVQEIHHVRGRPQPQRRPRLAADEQPPPPRRAHELRHVGDELRPRPRLDRPPRRPHRLPVADLEAHAPGHGGHAGLRPEVEGEPLREVERDDGHVEREARVLEGVGGGGPHGEDVVDLGEGGEAEGEGARVGEGERRAVQDVRELLLLLLLLCGGSRRRGGGGGEIGEGCGVVLGRGGGEGVVEGDGAVAQRGGHGEQLQELVRGRGRGPGHVEVVEHGLAHGFGCRYAPNRSAGQLAGQWAKKMVG